MSPAKKAAWLSVPPTIGWVTVRLSVFRSSESSLALPTGSGTMPAPSSALPSAGVETVVVEPPVTVTVVAAAASPAAAGWGPAEAAVAEPSSDTAATVAESNASRRILRARIRNPPRARRDQGRRADDRGRRKQIIGSGLSAADRRLASIGVDIQAESGIWCLYP